MKELPLKICTDCGKDTYAFSKRFQTSLCRDCWDIRTGWDEIKLKANEIAESVNNLPGIDLLSTEWPGDKLFKNK